MNLIPSATRNSGSYQSPSFKVNDRTVAIVLSVPRKTTADVTMFAPDDVLVGARIFASYNDGQTWGEMGSFTAFGGYYVRRDGTVATESRMVIKLPPGVNRLITAEVWSDKRCKVAVNIEEILGVDGSALMFAIAYDNAQSTSSASNVASLTTAAWTIAGANRLLMGGIMSGAGTPVNPSGMKWGGSSGTALTQRGSTVNCGSFGKVSQFSLVAPTAASQTLYGNWGSNQDETAIGGVSYTGVDQATPHGTQTTASGTGNTPTVNISSAAGELVSDVVMCLDQAGALTAFAAGAGQTERVKIASVGAAGFEAFGMSEEAGGVTVTMSWSATVSSGTNDDWAILGIPIKASSGGGGVTGSPWYFYAQQ